MGDDKVTSKKPASGPELYPVLPLRDIVVFPYMIVPLFVGREKSINALEEVMHADKHILLAAQKNASDDDDPGLAENFEGMVARRENDPVLIDREAGDEDGQVKIDAGETREA